jgi:hypothetical protein
MVAIPSDDAAREAWAALPAGVRAEVLRLAAQDKGHPDPAVAAIAVGLARTESRWPWWRIALLVGGLSLFFGEWLGGLVLGGSIDDIQLRGFAVIIVPIAVGFASIASASKLRSLGAVLPRWAEIVNLRTFLSSPQAQAAPPERARLRWLTPRAAAAAGALVVGIGAVAYAVVALMGLPLRPAEGLRRTVDSLPLFLLILGTIGLSRRMRRRPRRAKHVTVGEDGLRFGWRGPIPWSEVTGATLSGPTSGRPDLDGVIVWMLRGGPTTVETPLHSGVLPEELILAARSYLAATSAVRTA